MIVPVNVVPNSLQAPAQTQQAASQQLAFSSPDLKTAPSLKKSVRLQAMTVSKSDNLQQELIGGVASGQDLLSATNQKNQSVDRNSKQLVAQAASTSQQDLLSKANQKNQSVDLSAKQPVAQAASTSQQDLLFKANQKDRTVDRSAKQLVAQAASTSQQDLLFKANQKDRTVDRSAKQLVAQAASTSQQDLLSKANQKNGDLNSRQLVAQATPNNSTFNNGLPSDLPPLEQIPTLQPQTEPLQAVPTSRPESVTPQSNSTNGAQPQQSSGTVVQNGQSFPPPSQVLPQPTGVPAQPPANYTPGSSSSAPYYNQNYLGPAVSFGNETLFGATSRFGLGRNFSLRPSLFLGNNTRATLPLTFDFDLNNNEQFEANPLLVFHAGGGIEYSSGGASGGRVSPLAVAGADIYFGDGASVLVQVGTAFDSNVVGVVGVGLQF
jgi:hypothetical protein